MSHLSHPIRVPQVVILNFVPVRENNTELHREGCTHARQADRVSAPMAPPAADDGYDDDWYHVAPCARKAIA